MKRVILLGASNLTISFRQIIQLLRRNISGPLQILAAHGHGRSYGIWSRVLMRELPGISQCNLWQTLSLLPQENITTSGLITDIGNDLLYGVSVTQILEWVKICIKRLHEIGAQLFITRLPLASLQNLSRIRYYLTKAFFFPNKKLSWKEMFARATALDQGLIELEKHFPVTLVTPSAHWYGFDPIHIRFSYRKMAWNSLLSNFFSSEKRTPEETSWKSPLKISWLKPAERKIFQRLQKTAQPAFQAHQMELFLF